MSRIGRMPIAIPAGVTVEIAENNKAIFSTQTAANTTILLFEKLTNFITDDSQRTPFARALVDKLVNFSFEEVFQEKYDFFSFIFEYLIKDYNTAGGGKYAEYYTPHAIATIMARLLVGDNTENLHSMECYDPSAGTGTLLMALSHQIGIEKCSIFSQDISQRSNKMLKLGILNEIDDGTVRKGTRNPIKYSFNLENYNLMKTKGFRLEF